MWAIVNIQKKVEYFGTKDECLKYLASRMSKSLKMVPAHKDSITGEIEWWDGSIYE